MFTEKKYLWSDNKTDSSIQYSAKRIFKMLMFWVCMLIVDNVLIGFILQRFYKIYTKGNGLRVLFYALKEHGMHGAIYNVLFIFVVLFLIEAILFDYIFRKFYKSTANNDTSAAHGTAHWATQEDIRQAGLISNNDGGVVLSLWKDPKTGEEFLLTDTGPDHVIMNAPTRAGKGVSGVVPTLLNWKHSVIVLDIKGENWEMTSGYRSKELGQYCFRFEPSDPCNPETIKTEIERTVRREIELKNEKPEPSFKEICRRVDEFYEKNKKYLGPARWNPLLDVHIGSEYETSEVQQIATMLADPEGKGLKDYWDKEAFALLTGTITYELYKARKEGREPSLAGIRAQLATGEDLNAMFDDWKREEDLLTTEEVEFFNKQDPNRSFKKIHPIVLAISNSMGPKPDKELSGIVGTAMSNLELFLDGVIGQNTRNGTFTISDIVNSDKPVSLYIVVPPKDLPRLRPLLRLFIVLLINGLTGKMLTDPETGQITSGHLNRLLLLLDEFPQLKKMDQVQVALAQMAGYGLKAYIICQSFTQLFTEYGKDENVSSNCNIQIAFAPNDDTTAKILSDMCGKKTERIGHMSETIDNNSLGRKKVTQQISYQEHERPLMYPDEVRRLPGPIKDGNGRILKPGEVLIFPKNMPAIRGIQSLFFKNSEWLRRTKILPPIITVNVKERTENIRIAIEKWQRVLENHYKSVDELIANKKEAGLSVLSDRVIKKWFNPALRRNPNIETEMLRTERQRELIRKNKEMNEKNEKFKNKVVDKSN